MRSIVWKNFQDSMLTELKFTPAFRLQTNSHLKRTIQVLEDSEDHLPLVEFAYNNNYQYTIRMVSFEVI